MNLQQLEYIVSLGQHRHFGKAAEHCSITQPTLSTMLQKLEDELGVKIFDRSRQAIQPTPVGHKILAQAAVILRQVEIMREIITNESNALSGHLTIGVLPTIAPYLLPRLIPILERKLSKLSITFVELITSACLEHLRSDEIDVALIASLSEAEDLTDAPLYYEEFIAYISEREPLYEQQVLRSSEVDPTHLWLLDEGHCFRNQLLKFCALRGNKPRRLDYNRGSLETFMHMVERGSGITFIPELCMLSLDQSRRRFARPFTIPRPARQINLCTRADFVRTKLKEVLMECILEAVPEEMHQLRVGQTLV